MTLPETDFNYDTVSGKKSDGAKFEKILKEYIEVIEALKLRCMKKYGNHAASWFGI